MKRIAYKNMKQLSRMLSLLLCAAVLWTACSSDDEDDNGGESDSLPSRAGVYNGEDGVSYRIHSIGSDIYYNYDEDGELSSIKFSNTNYKITTSPLLFSASTGSFSNFTFNSSGFISGYKCTEIETDIDYTETMVATVKISYNSDGQILKQSIRGQFTWVCDGEKESYSGDESLVYTYKDGNLQTVVYDTGNDYKETYNFLYDGVENPLRQTSFCSNYLVGDGITCIFGSLGLMGYASNEFPTSIIATVIDEGDKYTETMTLSYKVENGLLQAESMGLGWLNYDYETLTKAVLVQPEKVGEEASSQLPQITFFRQGRRLKAHK